MGCPDTVYRGISLGKGNMFYDEPRDLSRCSCAVENEDSSPEKIILSVKNCLVHGKDFC